MKGAGVIFTTPDGLALFLKRAAGSDHAGTWAWPGGGIEDGETAEEAARREALEEIGHETKGEFSEVDHEEDDENGFSTFHQGIDEPFLPQLNSEHTAYAWAPLIDPPSPLHPGVQRTLDAMDEVDMAEMANDAVMAFDRAMTPQQVQLIEGVRYRKDALAFDRASVRRTDIDGNLHLDTSNISKANVCPYLGKEIPNFRELGLIADKIYRLYRDPDELAKAEQSFNNLRVLSEHVEVNSLDHHPELVIGTTGTDASFEAPYMRNSLAFWVQEAIDDIDEERKKELSSAYRYRADMTPGTSPEGEKFDGVMRDIIGNHVALVKEGRAGPDVVVGDSKEELNTMGKIKISQKAMMARGAIAAFLQPRLAADAKMPALTPMLLGVNAKNFGTKKSALATALGKAFKPVLAKDASTEGLVALLDGLEKAPVQDDMDPMDDISLDAPDSAADPGVVPVEKPDPMEAVMAFLQGKLSPEDLAQLEQLVGGGKEPGAKDEPPDFKGMPKPGGKMVGDAGEQKDVEKEPLTKAAMDAALEKTRKDTLAEATKVNREIRDAERAVRPYIGEVTKAFDSASDVYKSALTALKVDVEGVDSSAYPAMLKLVPIPGSKPTLVINEQRIAQDAAATADFEKRFPNASRIRNV